MKHGPFFILIIFSASLLISSCKKSESTPEPEPAPASFTFKVDGTAVTADSANAVLYSLGVAPYNREIDVYAFKAGQQVLEMHFHPAAATYPASASFDGAWLTYDQGAETYDSQSGTLSLTTCDTVNNKITGTFNFIGKVYGGTATKTITEGNLLVTRLRRQ
jgi:hypothetical protein